MDLNTGRTGVFNVVRSSRPYRRPRTNIKHTFQVGGYSMSNMSTRSTLPKPLKVHPSGFHVVPPTPTKQQALRKARENSDRQYEIAQQQKHTLPIIQESPQKTGGRKSLHQVREEQARAHRKVPKLAIKKQLLREEQNRQRLQAESAEVQMHLARQRKISEENARREEEQQRIQSLENLRNKDRQLRVLSGHHSHSSGYKSASTTGSSPATKLSPSATSNHSVLTTNSKQRPNTGATNRPTDHLGHPINITPWSQIHENKQRQRRTEQRELEEEKRLAREKSEHNATLQTIREKQRMEKQNEAMRRAREEFLRKFESVKVNTVPETAANVNTLDVLPNPDASRTDKSGLNAITSGANTTRRAAVPKSYSYWKPISASHKDKIKQQHSKPATRSRQNPGKVRFEASGDHQLAISSRPNNINLDYHLLEFKKKYECPSCMKQWVEKKGRVIYTVPEAVEEESK